MLHDTLALLLDGPHLPALVSVFFFGRLLLPFAASWMFALFRTKRELAAAELRLIEQRLSRLVMALLLTAMATAPLVLEYDSVWLSRRCAWRAVGTTQLFFPDTRSPRALLAIRAMMWYLLADR